MAVRLAGIDYAVQPTNVGIALASLKGHECRVVEARKCGVNDPPAEAVAAWHKEACISLVAVDAPLGWPAAMSNTLSQHVAGAAISVDSNQLFRRDTDREIYRRLGKQPLDVGANFIARTAKAALTFLHDIRSLTGEAIPLVWDMCTPASPAAIEVYPAATIRSMSLPVVAYKKTADVEGRLRILETLPDWFDVAEVFDAAVQSPDVLDAVLCVLAAVEFCLGRAIPPQDKELARKEGWIWAG